ncbi:MAG: hypothetical protein MI723_18065 [Caulobacterales bacterium]|nr:hypothetical protein [Caulobacterales bacterium]
MPSPAAPLRIPLARVPTALFPMALGMAGVGAALRAADARFAVGWLDGVGIAVLTAAGVALVTDALLYAGKLLRAPDAARAEFADPTSANLLAPAFMAAMVIGAQLSSLSPIGGWLWAAAAAGHGALLIRFVGRWLTHDFPSGALNPTWFLPAAGIMTGSMTAPPFAPDAAVWMMFAAGLVLWIALTPLVLRRVIFEPMLEPALRPSLFIIAAPAGLAANSALNLAPDTPLPAALLASYGVFVILVLMARPRFLAGAGVSLTWWATTFPTAAVAAAALNVSVRTGDPLAAWAGAALTVCALAFLAIAIAATVRVAWRTRLGSIDTAEREIAAMRGET